MALHFSPWLPRFPPVSLLPKHLGASAAVARVAAEQRAAALPRHGVGMAPQRKRSEKGAGRRTEGEEGEREGGWWKGRKGGLERG